MIKVKSILILILFFYSIVSGEPCMDYDCDYWTVRAILDSNEFYFVEVDSVSDSSNGRIYSLNLSYDIIKKPPSETDTNNTVVTVIPDVIGDLTELTSLNLYSDSISSLPVTIGNLKKLTHFTIEKNILTSIPDTICSLVNLTYLNMGGNELVSIPDNIGNLVNLQTLIIYENELTNIPNSIGNLLNLEVLKLSVNKIEKFS